MSEASSVRSEILDSPPFNIGTLEALTAGMTPRQAPPMRVRSASGNRFGDLYGASPIMQQLFRLLGKVAPSQAVVLIKGESGTGKELAATTIHKMSTLSQQPFVAVNCGAFPPNLVEAELFGHERGGFTGAVRLRKGCFERASGGTLFLDEVTEMPLDMQVKLLRVLETGTFMRVGSMQVMETDVRIVAATNRDPLQAVAAGKLREDLLYRLNVFPIHMPPLRERADDIPIIAEHFLDQISQREGDKRTFSPEALVRLSAYPWPGNVRELRNIVYRAY